MTDTIALIDEDVEYLKMLSILLDDYNYDVKPFRSPSDFFREIDRGVAFSCLVCNVRMPEMNSLSLLEILRRNLHAIPVVLTTSDADVTMAVSALQSGAHEFVKTPCSAYRLHLAISSAIETAQRRIAMTELERLTSRVSRLTDRQRQVMDLAAQGFTNREIADVLKISFRTVAKYRAWGMKKTGARCAADLARFKRVLRPEQLTDET